jgi:putative Ca2+/H+ antiporter (TMEM165/GDT1 family)
VDPATVATAFATIFVAELPDKTMLATIVLSARFRRPLAVWIGAASALTAQMLIAVTAGQLLGLLPDRAVQFGVAALFATGAIVLWRTSTRDDATDTMVAADVDLAIADGDAGGRPAGSGRPWPQISASVFGVVFVAEWGDLTQLTAASLAARGNALSVFVGATAAMLTVAAIGVIAGRALLRLVPERTLHRVAAAVFAALAVFFLVEAMTHP